MAASASSWSPAGARSLSHTCGCLQRTRTCVRPRASFTEPSRASCCRCSPTCLPAYTLCCVALTPPHAAALSRVLCLAACSTSRPSLGLRLRILRATHFTTSSPCVCLPFCPGLCVCLPFCQGLCEFLPFRQGLCEFLPFCQGSACASLCHGLAQRLVSDAALPALFVCMWACVPCCHSPRGTCLASPTAPACTAPPTFCCCCCWSPCCCCCWSPCCCCCWSPYAVAANVHGAYAVSANVHGAAPLTMGLSLATVAVGVVVAGHVSGSRSSTGQGYRNAGLSQCRAARQRGHACCCGGRGLLSLATGRLASPSPTTARMAPLFGSPAL